jgi:UDP-glucose 6-dehydrogenase
MNSINVFESDDKEKSIAGITFKLFFNILPYFIPGVNTIYGGIHMAYGLASIIPTVYKSVEGMILGGDNKDCNKVIDIIKPCYDGRHKFIITKSELAELVKFMENSWIATKVSFCNEFNNICNMLDVDYNELRELFILDPRVNSSHTFVYKDTPYWDSHCLNKDVKAISKQFNSYLLKNIIKFNDNQKEFNK